MSGVVAIAIVVLAWNSFGNNDDKPLSPAIPASTSASGGNVSVPTATKTPAKASATSRPTATQVTSGYADPTMYDDFDNVAYNGKVNGALWIYGGDTSYMRVFQENGSSVFTVSEANNCSALHVNNDYNSITQPMFIETRMMLDPESTIWGTDLGITFNAEDGHSVCSIFPGQDTQEISCWSKYFGVDQRHYKVRIVPGTWHILRIEVYPQTMQFSYLVDGEEIGAYIPRNSEPMKNIEYELLIRLCNWGGYAQNPVGYVDYVRMGAIEDDPTSMKDKANSTPSTATSIPPDENSFINGVLTCTYRVNGYDHSIARQYLDTGIVLKKGENINIEATGTVCFGGSDKNFCNGPNGHPDFADNTDLVGKIGNGEMFHIGTSFRKAISNGTGKLYLGFNDTDYENNSGYFDIIVTIENSLSTNCNP